MRSRGCATSVDSSPAVKPEMVSTRTGGIPFWGALMKSWVARVSFLSVHVAIRSAVG